MGPKFAEEKLELYAVCPLFAAFFHFPQKCLAFLVNYF
jgi:hypothetical protein